MLFLSIHRATCWQDMNMSIHRLPVGKNEHVHAPGTCWQECCMSIHREHVGKNVVHSPVAHVGKNEHVHCWHREHVARMNMSTFTGNMLARMLPFTGECWQECNMSMHREHVGKNVACPFTGNMLRQSTRVPVAFTRGNICGQHCRHTCCFCCIHTRQHLWTTLSAYMLLLLHSHEATFVDNMSAYMLLLLHSHEATFVGNNVGIHVASVAFTRGNICGQHCRHTCCFCCIHTRQHLWTTLSAYMLPLLHSHEATFVGNNVGIHVASVAFTRGNICGQHCRHTCCLCCIHTRQHLWATMSAYMLLLLHSHEATFVDNIVGIHVASVAFTRGNICGQHCRHTCCFCCIHTRQHLWTTLSAYMLPLLHSHEATFVGNNVGIHVASVAFTRGNICGQHCRHTCCFCCIHTRQHLWTTLSAYMLPLLHSHEATFVGNNVGIHVASVAFTRGNICGQHCRHTCCLCCIHTRQHLWATMSAYMLLLLHSHEATFVDNIVGIHVASVAFTRGNICGQHCRHTCCLCCIHTRQHLWATMSAYMCSCCIHTRQHLWTTLSAYMLLLLHSHEATFVDNIVGIHVASVAFTRGNICGQHCRHTCCLCCIHTRQHLWATMSAYMLLLLHSHEATFVDNIVGIHVASVAFTRGNICGQHCRHTCCFCCIHTRQHLWTTLSAYMLPLLHSHEATFVGNNVGIHVASVAFTRGNICGQHCRHTCCLCCIHTRQHLWATMSAYMLPRCIHTRQHLWTTLSAYMLLLLHSHEATFVDNIVGIHVASVAFTRGNICGQQCRHTCCFCCIHTRQHLWTTLSAYMLLLLHSHEATFVDNIVGIHVASVAFTRGNICGQQCRHTCCFCCIHTRQHLWATMSAYILLMLHSHEATFVGNNVGIHIVLLHSHEATFVDNIVGIHVASVAFTRGNICGQHCRHTCCLCCIHTRQHLWTTMSAYMLLLLHSHEATFVGNNVGIHVASCCIHTRQHLWTTMSAYMLLLLHSHEATFVGNNVGIHVAHVAFTRGNICGQQCRHTCCFCCIHTRQHLWATMSAYMLLVLHSHEATFVGNNVGIHVASVAFTRGTFVGNNVGIHVASVAFTRGNICGQQCRHTCVPVAFTRGNICGQQCRHTCVPVAFTRGNICGQQCRHTCCFCCIHTRQHLWTTLSAYMLLLLHSHEATFVDNIVGIHVASCCIHTRQHLWTTMSAYMLLLLHSHEATFVGNNVGIHVARVAFTRGNICGQQCRHTNVASVAFTRGNICGQQCRHTCCFCCIHTRQHLWTTLSAQMLPLLHSHEATFVDNNVGIHVASVAFTRGNICGQQCRHTCCSVAFTRGNICGQQCRHTCCFCCIHTRQHLWATMSAYILLMLHSHEATFVGNNVGIHIASVAFTRGNICGQQCRHTCCSCCIHTRQHLWATMSAYMLLLLHSHEATFVGNNVGIHVASVAFTRGNICGQQCRHTCVPVAFTRGNICGQQCRHTCVPVAFTRGNICGQQCRHTCCSCCIHTRQHLWTTLSAYMLLLLHSHEATFVGNNVGIHIACLLHSHEATFVDNNVGIHVASVAFTRGNICGQQCRHTCCSCCIHTRQHLWATMSAYMLPTNVASCTMATGNMYSRTFWLAVAS